MSKPTDLQEYIATTGDAKCAAEWGYTLRAVAAWRRGERTPDVDTARTIITRTGGLLTWESIYGNPSESAA